jgi:hypothetical protein
MAPMDLIPHGLAPLGFVRLKSLLGVPPGSSAVYEFHEFRGAYVTFGHALSRSQLLLYGFESNLQFVLSKTRGQVASRAFGYAAHHICCPAQIVGDGIGEVDRDEQAVNFVHVTKQSFRFGEFIVAKNVENATAQFSRRFTQPA